MQKSENLGRLLVSLALLVLAAAVLLDGHLERRHELGWVDHCVWQALQAIPGFDEESARASCAARLIERGGY